MKNYNKFKKIVKTILELITLFLAKHAAVAAFIYINHHYNLTGLLHLVTIADNDFTQFGTVSIVLIPKRYYKKIQSFWLKVSWYLPRIFILTSMLCNISHCEWNALGIDFIWLSAELLVHHLHHNRTFYRKCWVNYGKFLKMFINKVKKKEVKSKVNSDLNL